MRFPKGLGLVDVFLLLVFRTSAQQENDLAILQA